MDDLDVAVTSSRSRLRDHGAATTIQRLSHVEVHRATRTSTGRTIECHD